MTADHLCLGCMSHIEKTDAPCPNCGWLPSMKNAVNQLEAGYTLTNENHTEKYIVGKSLGQGGFGITYPAWDINRKEKVVIKEYFPVTVVDRERDSRTVRLINPQMSNELRDGMTDLLKEAYKMLAFQNVPNIVTVKNFFQANNTAYIVMEYIDGETLRQVLDKSGGILPLDDVLNRLEPIARALENMHTPKIGSGNRVIRESLIHRDISPDNIIFAHDGTPTLIDFGSSRSFGDNLSAIVKTGYSPPEQFLSNTPEGPWTDVYAFAATIYHAITGKLPPNAIDRMANDTLILPSSSGVNIKPFQEAALLKGLAVNYLNRYQTVAEFVAALRQSEPPKTDDDNNIVPAMILTIVGFFMAAIMVALFAYTACEYDLIGDVNFMLIFTASTISAVCLGACTWDLVRIYMKKPAQWLCNSFRRDVAFLAQICCTATFVLLILIYPEAWEDDFGSGVKFFLMVYCLVSVIGMWLGRQNLKASNV